MVDRLVIAYGDYWGHWVNAASFFGNVILIASLTTSCRPHGIGGRGVIPPQVMYFSGPSPGSWSI